MSNIDLGGVELNSELLVKQIRQDIKDDWFKDPLEHMDALDPKKVHQKISKNIERNHGRYLPSQISIFDIPKKNFTLRYSIEKSIYDRVFYHGLTVFLIPYFDALFSSRSFSHRLQPSKKTSKEYLFKNGVEQWKEYRGVVRAKLKNKYLLETDINTYFENIEVGEIKESLIKLIPQLNVKGEELMHVRRAIDLLFEALPFWTYDKSRGRGLPQNRDASSFLANVFMHEVDINMIDAGFDYYRYMDDIKIICDSEHETRRALMKLTHLLRAKGLGLNSKKTEIHHPGAIVNDLEPNREIEYIETLLKSKQKVAIIHALEKIINLTIKLIKTEKTQEREFRYCIGKLEKISRCEDFTFDRKVLNKVTRVIVKEIDKSPVTSDQYINYLKSCDLTKYQAQKLVSFLLDEQRAIYPWQNYQIWKLFVYRGLKNQSLVKYAEAVIRNDNSNSANRAGAALYIGKFGSYKAKKSVAKEFQHCKDFIDQRASLIAMQDLNYYDDIKGHVNNFVLPDLQGVLSALKNDTKYKGVYHSQPKPILMKDLFGYKQVSSGGEV